MNAGEGFKIIADHSERLEVEMVNDNGEVEGSLKVSEPKMRAG